MRARVAVLLALLCGLALAVVPVLGVGPASAHDALRATEPAARSTVTTPPTAVRLTFTEPILDGTAKVQVTGPTGVVSTGQLAVQDTTVAAALTAPLPNGGYTVLWRVTSADGHPVSGKFAFTITAATTASAATASTVAAPAASGSSGPPSAASGPAATSAAAPSVASSPTSAALDTTPVTPTVAPTPSTTPIVVAVVATLIVAAGAWWLRGRRRPPTP